MQNSLPQLRKDAQMLWNVALQERSNQEAQQWGSMKYSYWQGIYLYLGIYLYYVQDTMIDRSGYSCLSYIIT